jgi:hypothetical protein
VTPAEPPAEVPAPQAIGACAARPVSAAVTAKKHKKKNKGCGAKKKRHKKK